MHRQLSVLTCRPRRGTVPGLPTLIRSTRVITRALTYALADLAALPGAAVVVEDRHSRLFSFEHAPGATAAEALAEAPARFPSVPIVFCETRPLAQEWAYRWLGACLAELDAAAGTADVDTTFASGGPVPAAEPRPAAVREWARAQGLQVSDRGRVPADLVRRYLAETGTAV